MEKEHMDCEKYYRRVDELAERSLRLALESGVKVENPGNYITRMRDLIWKEMEEVYKWGC